MFKGKKNTNIFTLPEKRSNNWFYIFFASWVLNLFLIILSRYLIDSNFELLGNLAFALVALFAALLASLGYIGLKVFSYTFISFNLMAVVYMLFIAITNASDGWTDLTSIVGYMFFILLGVLVATSLQMIYYFIKKIRSK